MGNSKMGKRVFFVTMAFLLSAVALPKWIPLESRPGYASTDALFPLKSDPAFRTFHQKALNKVNEENLTEKEISAWALDCMIEGGEIGARIAVDFISRAQSPDKVMLQLQANKKIPAFNMQLMYWYFKQVIIKRNISRNDKRDYVMSQNWNKLEIRLNKVTNVMAIEYAPTTRTGNLMMLETSYFCNSLRLEWRHVIKKADALIAANPKFAPYYAYRSRLRRQLKWSKAKQNEDLFKAFELAPDNTFLLRTVGATLVPIEPKRARILLEKWLARKEFAYGEELHIKKSLEFLKEKQ
jgi:hypothetical protein